MSKIMLPFLPFPPKISASDIIDKRKPCRTSTRSPNAFMIYRKVFLDQLYTKYHNLKMTDVSKLVSLQWKNETEIVKEEYRKISQDVKIELSKRSKEGLTNRIIFKSSKYSPTHKRNR